MEKIQFINLTGTALIDKNGTEYPITKRADINIQYVQRKDNPLMFDAVVSDIYNLPAPKRNTIYIVNSILLDYLDRPDLVSYVYLESNPLSYYLNISGFYSKHNPINNPPNIFGYRYSIEYMDGEEYVKKYYHTFTELYDDNIILDCKIAKYNNDTDINSPTEYLSTEQLIQLINNIEYGK